MKTSVHSPSLWIVLPILVLCTMAGQQCRSTKITRSRIDTLMHALCNEKRAGTNGIGCFADGTCYREQSPFQWHHFPIDPQMDSTQLLTGLRQLAGNCCRKRCTLSYVKSFCCNRTDLMKCRKRYDEIERELTMKRGPIQQPKIVVRPADPRNRRQRPAAEQPVRPRRQQQQQQQPSPQQQQRRKQKNLIQIQSVRVRQRKVYRRNRHYIH